ncbi:hypothetical protein ACFXKX_07935 [Streptomyces scopuliridis]|uniref:hypothetical protein n=1 Tax=Streptomyces scopuliridis TaxID=452529 RepID=UPI0036759DFD
MAVRPGETVRRAALRFLRHEQALPTVRIAPLIGRYRAGAGGVAYVVLVEAAAGRWPDEVLRSAGAGARWWTVAQLRAEGAGVEPVQLLDLIDGYWEGWLPDGEISLD